jgi:N,N'-diacetyllegionaminate synthase
MKIGNKEISETGKAYIIAEVGQAHEGSIGNAHAFIDTASKTGVDAIKFQAHFAAEESTRDEKFRVNFSYQDIDRFDYWKRMEISPGHLKELKEHAESLNMEFICSPFSLYAIDVLEDINVNVWKIGSGEANWGSFMKKILDTKKPILYSTGMSLSSEIDAMVKKFNELETKFCLMQCCSKYPTPIEEVGIHLLLNYKKKYSSLVGFSDHSGSIWPSVNAMAGGAKVIEVHIKLSQDSFGPDSSSSLLPHQISQICEARDEFYIMNNSNISKDQLSEQLSQTRGLFSRSIALNDNYAKGVTVTADMIVLKKPGSGIPEKSSPLVIDKVLNRDYSVDCLLTLDDLSDIKN